MDRLAHGGAVTLSRNSSNNHEDNPARHSGGSHPWRWRQPRLSPPTDQAGPLTITIADPGEVQALERPIPVPVTLSNSSEQPLSGKLRIAVCDDWRVEGKAVRNFVVAPHGKLVVPVSVIAGRGTYAALYPVHAYADFTAPVAHPATAHAILIASVANAAVAARQTLRSASNSMRRARCIATRQVGYVPDLEHTGPLLRSTARRRDRCGEAVAACAGDRQRPCRDRGQQSRLGVETKEQAAGTHAAAVVPGPAGITDAFIAISDGRRNLVFEGFAVQIDQLQLGPPQHTALCDKIAAHFRRGRGVIDHDVFVLGKRA